MSKARKDWTLANELDHELRILRAGGTLNEQHDLVRATLFREEIAALKREVGALQLAAGIPHLQAVK